MKLVLSRKGFDSGSGGCPSPILPDGTMVSLPIPLPASPKTYEEIEWAPDRSMARLVRDLAPRRVRPDFRAHLDPDLRRESLPRHPDWRPLFGQIGQAQSHLANHGVGKGDLFVFFGLFRRVVERKGVHTFEPGSRSSHVVFGWLQVERVLPVDASLGRLGWASEHPHLHMPPNPANTIYESAPRLQLPGLKAKLPGAGVFTAYSPGLELTAPDARGPSEWLLPRWFAPRGARPPLSYHSKADRWRRQGERVRLRSVARGQEFVLDLDHYPEAFDWLGGIFTEATRR